MVHIIELIFFAFLIKAILRCLYFWQLKEYRFDRFVSFIKTSERRRFFVPTKSFLRPRLTIKALVLAYLSLYFSFQILRFTPQAVGPIAAFLLMPLITSLSVIILMPLTGFVYDFIIWLSKLKLRLLHSKLTVIGITGSYGKTSTKEILAHLLSTKFKVCKTPATRNTAIGVAITILKDLKKHHQYFVVEMGAYKKGEIKQICQMVKPKIGILTGITKQHLGLFGNFDKLLQAKYELIESLPSSGLAVINIHNQYSTQLALKTKHVKVKTYQYPQTQSNTNLIGDFQQLNIQAAVTAAKHLKVSRGPIKKSLLNIPHFKTAITQKIGFNKVQIIDDSYNSNPEGFKALIEFAKQKIVKTKILITPGMIELGKSSKEIHLKLFKKAETVFDQIYVTKEDLNFLTSKKTKLEPNLNKLLNLIKPKLNPNTLVLLEGRLPAKFIKTLCQHQF